MEFLQRNLQDHPSVNPGEKYTLRVLRAGKFYTRRLLLVFFTKPARFDLRLNEPPIKKHNSHEVHCV